MPPINTSGAETLLVAGPPAARPPLFIALILVALSLVAPFLFLRAGSPSPLLGIAVLALAAAGIITLYGAVTARLRQRTDAQVRIRARISAAGITLHAKPDDTSGQHFAAVQIATARLSAGALTIQTVESHPKPGRYVLRYGKLGISRDILIAALAELSEKSGFRI